MSVSFNNIPSGIRVPLFYAEVDNSAAFTPSDVYQTLIFGQMLSTGTATAGKPITISTKSMAIKLFGRGSMLARMVSAYRDVDTFGQLVVIPLADDASGVSATGTVTISGTATESGALNVYIGSTRVQAVVAEDDTAAEIATALANEITAIKDLPVTASAAEGVVTLTARNAGTLGNDIQIALNLRGEINGETTPNGVGVEIVAMKGGTKDPTLGDAVIAAMGDERYDFVVTPYSDTTVLDALAKEMGDASGRWSYTRQIYGHVYTAKRGTIEALKTFGKARNDQHCTIVGVEPELPSGIEEVLAAYVARTSVFISADPARPTQTGALTGIMAAPSDGRFILTERQTLLTSGIATLTTVSGTVQIERAITTYQKNAMGDADASYLDSETLHTLAYILRLMKASITSKYARHKLANDGTRYGAGQAIVTPSVIKGELIAQYRQLELKGIVENAELFKKYLVVERNVDNPNRLDVLFPPDLINQLRIFAVLAQFRLQYSSED